MTDERERWGSNQESSKIENREKTEREEKEKEERGDRAGRQAER